MLDHELHDAVVRTLSGLRARVQRCVTVALDDPRRRAELAAELERIRRLATEGIDDLRVGALSLALLHLKAEGLAPALRALVEEFSRSTGVPARVRVRGNTRLPEKVEDALYRAAYEMLVGVEPHARASGVVVSLDAGDRAVEMTVRDDGVGLDQRHAPDWRSTAALRIRITARSIRRLGGTFLVEPAEPRGLMIRARIPLAHGSTGTPSARR